MYTERTQACEKCAYRVIGIKDLYSYLTGLHLQGCLAGCQIRKQANILIKMTLAFVNQPNADTKLCGCANA